MWGKLFNFMIGIIGLGCAVQSAIFSYAGDNQTATLMAVLAMWASQETRR